MRRGRPDPESPCWEARWIAGVWSFTSRTGGSGSLRGFGSQDVHGSSFERNLRDSSTVLRQIAQFEPRGLVGLFYSYLLLSIHVVIFREMLKHISASALQPGLQMKIWS